MLRVYIDTQVISYLQHPPVGKEDVYSKLKILLDKRKNDLLLFYSVGHFSDFKRDSSNYKDGDLKFMEQLGIKYFIRYDSNRHNIYIKDEKPFDAFYKGKLDFKFNYKNRKNEQIYEPAEKNLETLYKRYYDLLTKVEKDFSILKSIPIREAEFYHKFRQIVPFNRRRISKRKFIKYVQSYFDKLTSGDKEVLRLAINDLIGGSKTSFRLPMYSLDFTKPTLKCDLDNSDIQSFFVERILEIMYMQGYKNFNNINEVFFLASCYGALETTGIINEKPSRLKIRNIVSDSQHAVFGSYCDVVITEDKKFSEKSKLLYGLFYFNTLIFNGEGFLRYFEEMLRSSILDKEQILSLSRMEVKRYIIEDKVKYGSVIDHYTIDSEWRYLGFFNNIEYLASRDAYAITFSRITTNYANPWLMVEIEALVNRSFNTFGSDLINRSHFNFKTEIIEIEQGIWPGRKWFYEGIYIQLYISQEDTRYMLLKIGSIKGEIV